MSDEADWTDLETLTREELIQRLRAQRALGSERSGGAADADRERLLHELAVHQFELQQQNQELREAHDEVDAARSRYLDLYEFGPIAYCTFDRNGVIVEINLTGAKLLGWDRTFLVGMPFLTVVQIERSTAFFAHLRETIEASVPVVAELAVKTEQGSSELQLVSSAVRGTAGLIRVRSAFFDVSAQRRAEREARAEKAIRARLDAAERASAAFSGALAQLGANDVAGFLQVVVDEARGALCAQYAALGIGGEADVSFVPWVFSGMSAAEVSAVMATPSPLGSFGATDSASQAIRVRDLREHQACVAFPSSHPAMTSFLAVPIKYQRKLLGHLYFANKLDMPEFTADDQALAELLAERIGVAMEIARLRRAETGEHAAAEVLAGRLASAVENAEDALALYDADLRLLLCNSAYRTLVHSFLPGFEIGRCYVEIVEAGLVLLEFESEEAKQAFRAARAEAPGTDRLDVQLRDGRRLRIRNRPTLEGGMVQTVLDLTEDARRERELAEARQVAERASAAKSEFLSSMSHELRTPLNAVLGFTQLLRNDRKQPLGQRHIERLSHIERAGEHLLQLINEILDLSCIEAGRTQVAIETVSVAEVLGELESTLAALACEVEIQVSVAPLPPGLHVRADRTRCKQVLTNFGSNAIKYGRKGGKVELRASQHDGFVRIAVADDGMGIAADKQALIFEPFQRAGRETGPIEGTGIGLALAKRLAELMGGSVGFETAEGRGSEFWIDLPIAERASGCALEASAQRDSAGQRLSSPARARVVYIEDNPESAALLQDLLRDFSGVALDVVPTAELGIDLVRNVKPNLVIMDIDLPTMSGTEAARQLRMWPQTREIPLIALSAGVMPRDLDEIRAAGFDRHLSKPVDVDELLRTIEHVLFPAAP